MSEMGRRAFIGVQILRDRDGRTHWRNVQAEAVDALPRRGEAVEFEAAVMQVVDYIPATWPILEVEHDDDAWVRALIRYTPASGDWGWCLYRLIDRRPHLIHGWRDGYRSMEEALAAAMRADS